MIDRHRSIDRETERKRYRSRSPSPERRRNRRYSPLSSDSEEIAHIDHESHKFKENVKVEETIDSNISTDEQIMKELLGFSSFDSTKGKHVPGADVSAADISKKRKYRQYMNKKRFSKRSDDQNKKNVQES